MFVKGICCLHASIGRICSHSTLGCLHLKSCRDVAGVHAVNYAPTASDHFQWVQVAKGGDIFVPAIPPSPLPGLSRSNDVSDLCKTILDGIIKREMEYGS